MRIVDPSLMAYPILAFGSGVIVPHADPTALTRCTKTALKNGYFAGLVLVDSQGHAHTIKRAEKVKGVGPFWGYNVFLNQQIEVRLYEDTEVKEWPIEVMRAKVLDSMGSGHGWEAGDDADELRELTAKASSHRAIAEIVLRKYNRPYAT